MANEERNLVDLRALTMEEMDTGISKFLIYTLANGPNELKGHPDERKCAEWLAEQFAARQGPITGMVPIEDLFGLISPTPSITRESSTSALGKLQALPVELLFHVLGDLDPRSLQQLSRTCLQAYTGVWSYKPYQEVLRHAPQALAALNATKILSWHSIDQIHHALCHGACVSCGEFGAALFLPNCQRACELCLRKNEALFAISPSFTSQCFVLKTKQVMQLPMMHSVPGIYGDSRKKMRNTSRALISLRDAKEFAMKVHGCDQEGLMAIFKKKYYSKLSWSTADVEHARYNMADLNPIKHGFWGVVTRDPERENPLYGLASVSLPLLLDNGEVEHGYLCRGCETNTDACFLATYKDDPIVEKERYTSYSSEVICYQLAERRRSREETLKHILRCEGVKCLAAKRHGTDWRKKAEWQIQSA